MGACTCKVAWQAKRVRGALSFRRRQHRRRLPAAWQLAMSRPTAKPGAHMPPAPRNKPSSWS